MLLVLIMSTELKNEASHHLEWIRLNIMLYRVYDTKTPHCSNSTQYKDISGCTRYQCKHFIKPRFSR